MENWLRVGVLQKTCSDGVGLGFRSLGENPSVETPKRGPWSNSCYGGFSETAGSSLGSAPLMRD